MQSAGGLMDRQSCSAVSPPPRCSNKGGGEEERDGEITPEGGAAADGEEARI